MTPAILKATCPAATDALPVCPARESATVVATITDLDRGVLVRIEGDGAILGVEKLQLAFVQVTARRTPLAVLDLSLMTFLSSLGMGQLVRLRRDLGRWNGRVKIASCPPAIRQRWRGRAWPISSSFTPRSRKLSRRRE